MANSLALQQFIDSKRLIHNELFIHGFFLEYRWLSNFERTPVTYEGVVYPSSENAYQAAKFAPEVREKFFFISPVEAKNLGKTLTGIRSDWEEVKVEVMRTILKSKFEDPILRSRLRRTGERHLEETNWWRDTFWGTCKGVGENNLGKLLMEIRATL